MCICSRMIQGKCQMCGRIVIQENNSYHGLKQAIKEGKRVQLISPVRGWVDAGPNPGFIFPIEGYRIHPDDINRPIQTPYKHAELIKAWADGAKIQRYHTVPCNEYWADIDRPEWYANAKYRIKPTPKPDVTRYAQARYTEYDPNNSSQTYQNEEETTTFWTQRKSGTDNIVATFDSETGKLKLVEMI